LGFGIALVQLTALAGIYVTLKNLYTTGRRSRDTIKQAKKAIEKQYGSVSTEKQKDTQNIYGMRLEQMQDAEQLS